MIASELLRDLAPAVEFGLGGRLYLYFLLIGVPLIAVVRPLDRQLTLPGRLQIYASAALGIWVIAGIAAVVLAAEDVLFAEVGLRAVGIASWLGWTVGATVAGLVTGYAITRIAARLGARESRLVFHLLPRDRRERWAFLGLSASAGFCEEFAYRGYALAGLTAWLGSGWWAAVVANLAFGVLHGYQNRVGVLRAAVLGYVFSLPVIAGVGLWPAIAAHFLMDALLGFGLWRWMLPPGQSAAQV